MARDWSSDVCSSDLVIPPPVKRFQGNQDIIRTHVTGAVFFKGFGKIRNR
jgi:hypothetical protein